MHSPNGIYRGESNENGGECEDYHKIVKKLCVLCRKKENNNFFNKRGNQVRNLILYQLFFFNIHNLHS